MVAQSKSLLVTSVSGAVHSTCHQANSTNGNLSLTTTVAAGAGALDLWCIQAAEQKCIAIVGNLRNADNRSCTGHRAPCVLESRSLGGSWTAENES